MEDLYAVIMAGGGGTRLWPLSRRDRPKQSLAIESAKTLFQSSVERVEPQIPAERIRVVTVAEQQSMLAEQAPQLPEGAFILEPMPRGTASVVGLAAVRVEAEHPGAVMAILTADHHVADPARLNQLIAAGAELARGGHLVTLGVTPSGPESGYGYLELGAELGKIDEFSWYEVQSFREKPSVETAATYLAAGNYRWNSGMFIWRTTAILSAIKEHMPELSDGLSRYAAALGSEDATAVLTDVWGGLQPQTVDYGIMEKADNVVALETGDIGWVDIGSFGRVFEILEADQDGNVIRAEDVVALDTSGTLLLQDSERRRLVAVLGVQDLVVIDTEHALLVVPRGRAQEVKALVEALRQRGMDEYL